MNTATDTILEQLSALMDGELPDAEARFLHRRIQADPQLQARWARMQVASSCIKGQPWEPARPSLLANVAAATGGEIISGSRHGILRWGVAASLVALAVLLGPRLLQPVAGPEIVASASAPAQRDEHLIPSPGSADLVAAPLVSTASRAATATTTAATAATAGDPQALVASNAPASKAESPLPLSAQSPTEFPLVEAGDKRSWPRSGLAQASDDPALEAYLVRHNQMLANDGLGGFVPYLDVVATDQASSTSTQVDSVDSNSVQEDIRQ